MFISMADEIKDLKDQNKLLKSENKSLKNELKTAKAEIQKLKPSTSKSKVQTEPSKPISFPGHASTSSRGPLSMKNSAPKTSAQLKSPKPVTGGYGNGRPGVPGNSNQPKGLVPYVSMERLGALPASVHPGSVRTGYTPRTPFPNLGAAPVQRPTPIRGGHPGSFRSGNSGSPYHARGPFKVHGPGPFRSTLPNKGVFPAGHPGSVPGSSRSMFPGHPVQGAPSVRQQPSIRGAVPVGKPVSVQAAKKPTVVQGLSPVGRRTETTTEVNQGWKFPVKAFGYQPVCSQKPKPLQNQLRDNIPTSGYALETSYKQFKSGINSSALPNKTSSQQKRPSPSSSIQPAVPVKRSRQEEETREPRFVCKIGSCQFSGCLQLPVFKSLDEHRDHMQNFHPERFLCTRCPYSSNMKGATKSHEKTHTKNEVQFRLNNKNLSYWSHKGLSCTFCNIKFAIGTIANCRSRLKKHNEQFHEN